MFGVFLSFKLFVPTLTAFPNQKEVGFAIAVIMLGVSYGAKFANTSAREVFTPLDLIQYLSQGFLWPSVWPSLATFLKIPPVAAPTTTLLIYPNSLATIIILFGL